MDTAGDSEKKFINFASEHKTGGALRNLINDMPENKPIYQVDDSLVPIPKIRTGAREKGQNLTYPFADLEPDQSFFVEGASARNLSGCAAYAGKILGRKFIARTMDGGVRVWRTE